MGEGGDDPGPREPHQLMPARATDRFAVVGDRTDPETGERRLLINDTHHLGVGTSFYVTEEEGMQLRNLLEWHLK